jgi:hypothetical protein
MPPAACVPICSTHSCLIRLLSPIAQAAARWLGSRGKGFQFRVPLVGVQVDVEPLAKGLGAALPRLKGALARFTAKGPPTLSLLDRVLAEGFCTGLYPCAG